MSSQIGNVVTSAPLQTITRPIPTNVTIQHPTPFQITSKGIHAVMDPANEAPHIPKDITPAPIPMSHGPFQQIDQGLEAYYHRYGSVHYHVEEAIESDGTFMRCMNHNCFVEDDIETELGEYCNPNECAYVWALNDFISPLSFPIPSYLHIPEENKDIFIFYILQWIYTHNACPSDANIKDSIMPLAAGELVHAHIFENPNPDHILEDASLITDVVPQVSPTPSHDTTHQHDEKDPSIEDLKRSIGEMHDNEGCEKVKDFHSYTHHILEDAAQNPMTSALDSLTIATDIPQTVHTTRAHMSDVDEIVRQIEIHLGDKVAQLFGRCVEEQEFDDIVAIQLDMHDIDDSLILEYIVENLSPISSLHETMTMIKKIQNIVMGHPVETTETSILIPIKETIPRRITHDEKTELTEAKDPKIEEIKTEIKRMFDEIFAQQIVNKFTEVLQKEAFDLKNLLDDVLDIRNSVVFDAFREIDDYIHYKNDRE
eukprot:792841_1